MEILSRKNKLQSPSFSSSDNNDNDGLTSTLINKLGPMSRNIRHETDISIVQKLALTARDEDKKKLTKSKFTSSHNLLKGLKLPDE